MIDSSIEFPSDTSADSGVIEKAADNLLNDSNFIKMQLISKCIMVHSGWKTYQKSLILH